ncbi:HAMP domain-containing sensor histidine kinase [Arthrobacter sp. STN4]|uniref:sensor histidine kinase n=1 Tax=Arthrobacter sp. STN4 TaxID=2923276 RepID=UPI002119B75B|nr:HAMP domain-containing sensor histidine kinase [Arthrobacter sp. STN4]MCQ9164208.1 HAMP domain-containing histidine kinase [Arthrobacter sp. STN4]
MNTRDKTELRRAVVWLALQFTALIVVLFVLLGTLIYSIVAAGVQESTNKTLAGAALIDSPSDAPLGVFVAISAHGQLLLSHAAPPGLPDTVAIDQVAASHRNEQKYARIDGKSYTVLTTYRDGKVIQVAVNQHERQEELNRLVLAISIATFVSAAMAAGLSIWIARRAMRPMAESLALQRRFVADASHELRTPLTLLSTRAQLLRRKVQGTGSKLSDDEVAAGVARLVDDAKMLTGILDDLLLSSDPRETIGHSLVNIVMIADSATALSEPEAQQRLIRLRRTGSPGPVNVRGSEVALLRVFTALIANALDHAATSVEVEVTVQGRDAAIRVIDDGPGFAAGTETRVFERFASSRLPAGKSDAVRHYGLGLALVAEIVALHSGKIMVEPGLHASGAVVNVLLPRVQS